MSVGIAMLARNSAEDMLEALAPFAGLVDQTAILLGGWSTDRTADVARGYADTWGSYTGPLSSDGGLLDFAMARQQSFDLLDTDFALVVDTDDRWQGVENLGEVISDAMAGQHQGVLFPYDLGLSRFVQPRMFRRNSGKWASPVHEHWVYNVPPEGRVLTTDAMQIRHAASKEKNVAGIHRNIRIAEHTLKDGRIDIRLLFHLAREYLLLSQWERGLETAQVILDNFHLANKQDISNDKLFQVHYMRGIAYLHLDRPEQAAGAAMMAMSYARFGDGWSLLAQCALRLGIPDLVLEAADKALAMGQPTGTIATPVANTTSAPYHLKAMALIELDRKHEAVTALDLGLRLGGGEDMKQLKYQLCSELGLVP
jgi:hypothetical protein